MSVIVTLRIEEAQNAGPSVSVQVDRRTLTTYHVSQRVNDREEWFEVSETQLRLLSKVWARIGEVFEK